MGSTEDPEEEQQRGQSELAPAESAEVNQVQRGADEKPTSNDVHVTVNIPPRATGKTELIQLGINGALVVIAVIAACIYGSQLSVMRGQLHEMQTEQRPWVYADFGPNGKIYRNQSGGFSIPVAFALHNTGHLPAQFVAPIVVAQVFGPGPLSRIVAAQKRICAEGIKKRRSPGWGTVFPGQTVPVETAAPISAQEWRSHIMDGFVPGVFIYGCIIYQSAKGHFSSTGFAFSVERAQTNGVAALNQAFPSDPTEAPAKQLRFAGIPDGPVWRAN